MSGARLRAILGRVADDPTDDPRSDQAASRRAWRLTEAAERLGATDGAGGEEPGELQATLRCQRSTPGA